MTRYRHRKPRSINLVSIGLVLLLAAGVYAGWKFIPVYYQAWKVDEILSELKNEASDLRTSTLSGASAGEFAAGICDRAVQRIHELGIIDQPDFPVRVEFSAGYADLIAHYRVVVTHPLVHKTTTIDFARTIAVPGGGGL